ncbi:hypothetical protein [Sebaldella termitidis]|uniref:hypothetical protein n=1 Tax=Sebaldella termitidis TaxID=826 RepID=UPI003EB85227
MQEVFKFINIQSASKNSEKALFFRKSFNDNSEERKKEWYKKLDNLNIPQNYSKRFPKAELNEFIREMNFQLELRINNKNFIMEIYENKRYKFIIIDNKREKVLELNFQDIVEKLRSNNRLGYNEFILCRNGH